MSIQNADYLVQVLKIVAGTREYPRLKGLHDLALYDLEEAAELAAEQLQDILAEEAEKERQAEADEQKRLQAARDKELQAQSDAKAKPAVDQLDLRPIPPQRPPTPQPQFKGPDNGS